MRVTCQIAEDGISTPSPAMVADFVDGQTLRGWADWQSFLKASINNAVGSQDRSEWESDPLWAYRIMGENSSVAQNLQIQSSFKGSGLPTDTEMLVWCIGTNVWEAVYDDSGSFMPTSVSLQEVI